MLSITEYGYPHHKICDFLKTSLEEISNRHPHTFEFVNVDISDQQCLGITEIPWVRIRRDEDLIFDSYIEDASKLLNNFKRIVREVG